MACVKILRSLVVDDLWYILRKVPSPSQGTDSCIIAMIQRGLLQNFNTLYVYCYSISILSVAAKVDPLVGKKASILSISFLLPPSTSLWWGHSPFQPSLIISKQET